jgi:Fe-S cluster assembly protein SufB
MATNNNVEANEIVGDYKYAFSTETTPVLTSGKGLNREVVEFISKAKNEPKWIRDFR